MDLNVKDKVVLITGGAKGIGAAITRVLADEGSVPAIIDKDSKSGHELECEILKRGGKARFFEIELSSSDRSREAVTVVREQLGRIDALVNNAGVNDKVGLEEGSPERYLESLKRNLLHFYDMAHFALPELKKSKGCIVNIASKTAITGQGGTSGYASSKGAILALTREWAVELLPYGIRVNAVVPAEVMTPLYRQWLNTFPDPERKLHDVVEKIPLGKRMTEPEEIAAMVAFLLADRATHITGQHLFVDGGYVHLDRALT